MNISTIVKKVFPMIRKILIRENIFTLAFALLFGVVVLYPIFLCDYNSGGFSGAPSVVGHCTCMGTKTDFSISAINDMPSNNMCIGIVTERWKRVQGVTVNIDATPRATSVLIVGALPVFTPPQAFPKQIKYDDLSKFADGRIVTNRVYEIRSGKPKFLDLSPLHIELKSPGYKTWTTDIVPDKEVIEVKANLEPEGK